NSAKEAAAEAPANPVPTTIIVNLRLLAGFTNFMLNLCFDHFSANGPAGTLESNRSLFLNRDYKPLKKKYNGIAANAIGIITQNTQIPTDFTNPMYLLWLKPTVWNADWNP